MRPKPATSAALLLALAIATLAVYALSRSRQPADAAPGAAPPTAPLTAAAPERVPLESALAPARSNGERVPGTVGVPPAAPTAPTPGEFETATSPPSPPPAARGPSLIVSLVGPRDATQSTWKVKLHQRREVGGEIVGRWPAARVTLEGTMAVHVEWQRYWTPPDPALYATVVVEDAAGLWSGSAPLPSMRYTDHEVTVTLDALASVRGEVVDSAGRPLDEVTVGLAPQTGERPPRDPQRWKRVLSANDGTFAMSGFSPGTYHLRLEPPYGPPTLSEVVLAPGPQELGRLVVQQRAVAGDVAGVIHSRADRRVTNIVVVLESIDGGGVRRTLWTNTPRRPFARVPHIGRLLGPERGARFHFAGVPAGRYALRPLSLDGYALEPTSLELEPPMTGIELRLVDDVATHELAVRAWDARTSQPLDAFLTSFHGPRWRFPGSHEVRFDETVGTVPRTGTLEWTVSAAGYRPLYGTLSSARIEGERVVVEARLEPGWGVELLILDGRDAELELDPDSPSAVLDPARATPIAGAQVHADGELVCTSDARGLARVSLPARPARLEVTYGDWRVEGPRGFEAGKVPADDLQVVVRMVD